MSEPCSHGKPEPGNVHTDTGLLGIWDLIKLGDETGLLIATESTYGPVEFKRAEADHEAAD